MSGYCQPQSVHNLYTSARTNTNKRHAFYGVAKSSIWPHVVTVEKPSLTCLKILSLTRAYCSENHQTDIWPALSRWPDEQTRPGSDVDGAALPSLADQFQPPHQLRLTRSTGTVRLYVGGFCSLLSPAFDD